MTPATLIEAKDVADFVARPIGRCVIGASFVTWCAAPDLIGTIQWGALDAACVAAMLDAARFLEHDALAPRYRMLLDCQLVDRVEPQAILGFMEIARRWLPSGAARIERQVIVIPNGWPGILVAGILPPLTPTYDLHFTEDVQRACELTGVAARARGAHDAAAARAAQSRGGAILIARLRRAIAQELSGPTIDRCAAVLGLSSRTLQRELADASTSFSDELRRVRVEMAEQLLHYTDLKIDAIAARVGAGSASRLSVLIRRERNATPNELRRRHAWGT
jgi:AraC-like DNA-binding protein